MYAKTHYRTISSILGSIIYFIIAVIMIPIYLYNNEYYEILEAYLPNVDLLANLLTFYSVPYIAPLFENLYVPSPDNFLQFWSKLFINYIALLGITYIISRETKEENSIIKGWSMGLVILLMTYLVPSTLIFNFLYEKEKELNKYFKPNISKTILLGLGILITISIIMIEKLILREFKNELHSISEFILSFARKYWRNKNVFTMYMDYTLNISKILLIIIILSLLGINIFYYLARTTDIVTVAGKDVVSSGLATTKQTVDVSTVGTMAGAKTVGSGISGAIGELEKVLDIEVTTGVSPLPDSSSSSVQTPSKSGFCYIGTDQDVRSCIYTGRNDTCASGKIYPTMDVCVNPNLRA